MSFFTKVSNEKDQFIIEQIIYNTLNRIPFATGATGYDATSSIINYDEQTHVGILHSNIEPDTNDEYSIGSTGFMVNNIYTDSMFINDLQIHLDPNKEFIDFPIGTTINSLNPSSVKILGVLLSTSFLPLSSTPGDAYIISNELWVSTTNMSWVNIGAVQGQQGITGTLGYTGYTGNNGFTGFTGGIGFTGTFGTKGPTGTIGPAGKT